MGSHTQCKEEAQWIGFVYEGFYQGRGDSELKRRASEERCVCVCVCRRVCVSTDVYLPCVIFRPGPERMLPENTYSSTGTPRMPENAPEHMLSHTECARDNMS